MERARFVTDRQTTDANGKNNVSPSGGDIMSYAGHKQFTIVSLTIERANQWNHGWTDGQKEGWTDGRRQMDKWNQRKLYTPSAYFICWGYKLCKLLAYYGDMNCVQREYLWY